MKVVEVIGQRWKWMTFRMLKTLLRCKHQGATTAFIINTGDLDIYNIGYNDYVPWVGIFLGCNTLCTVGAMFLPENPPAPFLDGSDILQPGNLLRSH